MESTRAYSQCRPIRVAFLVNEELENCAELLDAIFAECMGRWGGRFSLVVPATTSGPVASFQPWLRAFDPDIIYSYVDLTDDAVLELHESIYPSFLIRHDQLSQPANESSYRPRLPIRPLSVDTVIPLAAMPKMDGTRSVNVIESLGRMARDRLVRDSFGIFISSVGRSFGLPFNQFGRAFYLVADDEAQPRSRYGMKDAETANSIPALIQAMSTSPLLTMSQMSSMATPRLDLRPSIPRPAFNLVVGDSFVDRVFYWNARSCLPSFLDGSMVDLRLPATTLDDVSVVAQLAKLIRERNRVTDGSSNNTRVSVRSSSISLDRLNTLAEALRGEGFWMEYSVGVINSIDDCLPLNEDLSRANYASPRLNLGRSIGDWQEGRVEGNNLHPAAPTPEHLRFCPAGTVSPYNGVWAVDVDIERQVNYSKYDNVRHHWVFPRRLRILRSFRREREVGSEHAIALPRVERRGLLTLYADVSQRLPAVTLPADQDAIHSALIAGRDWWPFKRVPGSQETMPQQLLVEAESSSSGRYFRGVLGLFGDLNFASSILLHSLWREIFESLGASGGDSETREEIVKSRLRKRVQSLTVGSERDIQKLSSIVMVEAEHFRGHVPILSWDDLAKKFAAFQTARWAKETTGLPQEQQVEWQERERHNFREIIQSLCSRDILHQGYQHRCRKCLHRSWISLGELRRELTCEVCKYAECAPVDRPWDFRLNEFLREGVRQQGVLPLFWTLSKLRSIQEDGLFFEGPLDVYLDKPSWEGGKALTDVDLTLISNGRVHMCEVKQSGRQLNNGELIEFASLMKRLRPDVAAIAVMEPENEAIKKAMTLFESNLSGTGIESRLLTLDEHDFDTLI